MEKTKMKISDILSLAREINEGLLGEKIPFKTKYWLTRLGTSLDKEVKTFDKVRNDLVAKLGEKDKEGNIFIAQTVKKAGKDIPNPAMDKFKDEIESVLVAEVEFEHGTFELKDFEEVNSKNNYSVFYNLLKE